MKRGKLVIWSFALVLIAYLLMIISFFTQGSYFSGVSFIIAGILGIATLIMGIVSLAKINRRKLSGKGFATATIILSGILVIYFLYVLYAFYWLVTSLDW